ncbi:MAG: L,D-transpeptidase [Pseudonocardiales bacterium]|jgi:lipoprotein-anchoring transpeptidase ErfK/SrfK|nr:L,D-transpeptidase [Pseudonocardiales bacterium]
MAQHTSRVEARRAETSASRVPLIRWSIIGVAVVLVVALGFWLLGGGGPASSTPSPSGIAGTEQAGGAVDLAALPVADTYATVQGAPADPAPEATTDGTVAHPLRDTPVHDAPGGTPIARVEPTQFGDVWFPVIGRDGEWVQVLLPSRPTGGTGWIRAADLDTATTPYRIAVHLGSRTLELFRDGEVVEEWSVGVGASDTPTPTGRTFLLGAFTDPGQDFSPVILPLGTHSPTLDSYGGGPGTVAIHTWPDDSGFGEAISDGCIRVPADALDQLTEVPLGTLVTIDQE